MKAVILLATLKKEGISNTQTLSEFLSERMESVSINTQICRLVDYSIISGTYSNMGVDDEWPLILEKILEANIVIFATPIWWGTHSSELQRAIERLDELHDEILEGKRSRLEGKVGGILITGDSDGGEHITGNIANFYNAIGIVLPPYTTLSVLWDGQKKGASTTREELLNKYEAEYAKAADTMIEQMLKYSKL